MLKQFPHEDAPRRAFWGCVNPWHEVTETAPGWSRTVTLDVQALVGDHELDQVVGRWTSPMGLQKRRGQAVRPATLGPWTVSGIPSLTVVGGVFRWGAVAIAALVSLELILSSSVPLLGWTVIAIAVAIAVSQRRTKLRSDQENRRSDRPKKPSP